jgi:serine/threonine protein kinase
LVLAVELREINGVLWFTGETADKSGAGDADIAWEIDPRDLEFSQSLGMGSSGEVFEGTFMGNKVAVKVLKTNDTANEIEEFKKEFQVLVTMNSPYVIKFYGASLAEKLCMVMEHCARGSLYDVLNKKDLDLTWDRFFTFAKQSVAGVMALHKYNPAILHRGTHDKTELPAKTPANSVSDCRLENP